MKSLGQKSDSILLAYEIPVYVMKSDDVSVDCSEEAIPERDLTYRLPAGTACEEQTVEVVSAELRLDLARRLEQLGMNSARAAAVASL